MKFVLVIELGNDAMQTQGDLRDALTRVAASLIGRHLPLAHQKPIGGESGPIHDVNGNRVGGWHVE